MHRAVFLATCLAILIVGVAPLDAQPNGAARLPPGKGAAIVSAACSQCHSLRAITQLREGRRAWRDEVYGMILRGAQVGPAEIDEVVTYLAVNFGAGVALQGPVEPPVALPEGAGKPLVASACSLCHSLNRAVAAHRSKTQWKSIVEQMVYLGASLSPDQQSTIIGYLDSNFGSDQHARAR